MQFGIQENAFEQSLRDLLTCTCSSMQVFGKGTTKDLVVLMAARAARTENQDAIDGAIVNMLADPKEVRASACLQAQKNVAPSYPPV